MSFIAEFHVVSPLMRETAQAVPEMEFHTEDVHITQAEKGKHVFWASGEDFDRFESALQTDSTVTDYSCLTKIDSRRLYRVTHPREILQVMLYPEATEHDIVYLDITTTHDGSYFRVRAPSLAAFKDLRESCRERGIPFHLQRLYHEEPDDPTEQFGLTPAQHEVLVRAHERGYFHQPRNVTLEELTEEFEVSSSALGRRMRRALDTLIDQTVRSKTDAIDGQSSSGRDAT